MNKKGQSETGCQRQGLVLAHIVMEESKVTGCTEYILCEALWLHKFSGSRYNFQVFTTVHCAKIALLSWKPWKTTTTTESSPVQIYNKCDTCQKNPMHKNSLTIFWTRKGGIHVFWALNLKTSRSIGYMDRYLHFISQSKINLAIAPTWIAPCTSKLSTTLFAK